MGRLRRSLIFRLVATSAFAVFVLFHVALPLVAGLALPAAPPAGEAMSAGDAVAGGATLMLLALLWLLVVPTLALAVVVCRRPHLPLAPPA